MACFSYVAIFGTVAAPIYCGFIDDTIGWRWIEGIQGLANVPLLIVIALGLRETRGGVTLHKRAKALRAATGDERYKAEMDLEAKDLKEMLHNSSVKAIHMLITGRSSSLSVSGLPLLGVSLSYSCQSSRSLSRRNMGGVWEWLVYPISCYALA